MIYRDQVERYEIKNTSVLKFFIKRILASATKQLSVNTIYNELVVVVKNFRELFYYAT